MNYLQIYRETGDWSVRCLEECSKSQHISDGRVKSLIQWSDADSANHCTIQEDIISRLDEFTDSQTTDVIFETNTRTSYLWRLLKLLIVYQ